MTRTEVKDAIKAECEALCQFLWRKNDAYGNSALEPIRCFSKADTIEQLNVRADDKLSRIMRGEPAGEDPELDLMGYLLLKKVAIRFLKDTVPEECPESMQPGEIGAWTGRRLREQFQRTGVTIEEVRDALKGLTNPDNPERCSGCIHFLLKEVKKGISGATYYAVSCNSVRRGLACSGESYFSEEEANGIIKPDWCPGKKVIANPLQSALI